MLGWQSWIDIGHNFKLYGQRLGQFNSLAIGNSKPAICLATDKGDRRGGAAIVVHLKAQNLSVTRVKHSEIQNLRFNRRHRQTAIRRKGRWRLLKFVDQDSIGLIDFLQLAFSIQAIQRIRKTIRMIDAYKLFIARFYLVGCCCNRHIQDIVIIFHAVTTFILCSVYN